MAYKPTLTLPITGPDDPGDPYPSQLQQPIQMRRSIDASQNWFDQNQNADAVGDAIQDYYSATIGNFVNTQRRDYGAGVAQVHSKFFNMPGLTLQYENRQGQERLSMTCYPESFVGGGIDELNMDGYFLVFCTGWDPGTPPPGAQMATFDILVNGTSAGSATFTSNVQSAAVVMFGPTALKCESLADKDHGGPGNPNKSLVGRCLPPRPKTNLYNNKGNSEQFVLGPIHGYPVPAHPDVFGYFLYDWNDPLNTGMGGNAAYFQTPGGYVDPVHGGAYNPPGSRKPLSPLQVIKGDPRLIKNSGLNQFRVHLTTPYLEGASCTFVLQAEFYSRQDLRSVNQSWTHNPSSGLILVNDKPLYFSCLCSIAKNLPLNVDFTPQKTKAPTDPPTPTPEGAFNNSGSATDGTYPFNNGYFRPGDGWSSYNGQPDDPWGEVFVLVSLFSSALTTFKKFMQNRFTPGPPPVVVTIGIFEPPFSESYTITNQFFGSAVGAPMTQGAPIAEGAGNVSDGGVVEGSYQTVYTTIVSLEATWSTNLTVATAKAKTQDIFIPDSGALAMLNSLVSDGNTFMQLVFGSTNPATAIPSLPPIPSYSGASQFTPNVYDWTSTRISPFYTWQYLMFEGGAEGFVIENPDDPNPNATFLSPAPYTNPLFLGAGVEDGYSMQGAQLQYGWNLTAQFCAAIASPWSSALSYQPILAALLNSMINYTIPTT